MAKDIKAIKKAIIRKRNLKRFIIQKELEHVAEENERAEHEDEEKRVSYAKNYAGKSEGLSKEGSDKLAEYRNKMTGKKRKSRERWNRFAGTSGGGGRGL